MEAPPIMKQRILIIGSGSAVSYLITQQLQERGVTAVAVPDLQGLSVGEVNEVARQLKTVSDEGGRVGYLPGDMQAQLRYEFNEIVQEQLKNEPVEFEPRQFGRYKRVSVATEAARPELTVADRQRIEQAQQKRLRKQQGKP